ncbi:MAG: TrkA C-terminal domain-containing protein, partial [Eubacteriales bacterium]
LILIYQIIIEIFTMLCRVNGISVEKAKFQVVSLITSTGFTTKESEIMLLTRRRRKLTEGIMFFGYIFNICVVSIFMNIFVSFMNTTMEQLKVAVLLTLCNVLLVIIFQKTTIVKRIIDSLVVSCVARKQRKQNNYIAIYDAYDDKVIAEVEINHVRDELKNKSIEEALFKKNFGIQVLIVKRKGETISNVTSDIVLKDGDVIIVFGNLKEIKHIFKKKIQMKIED